MNSNLELQAQVSSISNQIKLEWESLTIEAKMKTGNKILINNIQGIANPGHLTAIMGPSGSGKTTLLSCLSGRLVSPNLTVSGVIKLNDQIIDDLDSYSNQFAYVMQDDVLLATLTPRGKIRVFQYQECFMFAANIRLKGISDEQKKKKVEFLLSDLGLNNCADTFVGGSLIRGVSGGERKRTSIGVELLTNPSLIFLDEPTTGLDSSTALAVLELLEKIASKGVNVVCTIHQPSSEIFSIFDQLILICRGNIIFQGEASQSVEYFSKIGFKCPDFSNPSDYFMKIMNEEGLLIEKMQLEKEADLNEKDIEAEFVERLEKFKACCQNTIVKAERPQKELKLNPLKKNDDSFNVGLLLQFILILKRSVTNEIRHPMSVKMKIVQNVVMALFCFLVFQHLGGKDTNGIQNRNGALFFLVMANSFGGFMGTLQSFTQEKNVFLRERASRSYDVGPYFWGKGLAEFPFELIYPIIQVSIVYYAIGLNGNVERFFWSLLILIITYQHASSYGQLISILAKSIEMATAMVPILIVPFLVVGGLYVNQEQIPNWLKWLEYLSMFKYGYQAICFNEFEGEIYQCLGPDQQYHACDPIKQHDFKESFGISLMAAVVSSLLLRTLAFFALRKISNPPKSKLHVPLQSSKPGYVS